MINIDISNNYVMRILNVTPDSFYDGGRYTLPELALKHAEEMITQGTDIIDIGGCSTRPFSTPPTPEEELNRVLPVIKLIKKHFNVPISIDTYRYIVAKAAIEEGAEIINDIFGLGANSEIPRLLLELNVKPYIVIMHIKGTPQTMQLNPTYQNVLEEIKEYFKERIKLANNLGVPNNKIIIDPGIGFGKTLRHNLEIIYNLHFFKDFNLPLLVGLSRKSFISKALERDIPPEERLIPTALFNLIALQKGANILRVHDVLAARDTIKIYKLHNKFAVPSHIN